MKHICLNFQKVGKGERSFPVGRDQLVTSRKRWRFEFTSAFSAWKRARFKKKELQIRHTKNVYFMTMWPEKIAFWGFTCPLIDNWSLDTPLEHETVKICYSIRIFSRCLPTPALLSSLDSLPRLRSLLQTKMVGVRYEHASIENSTKKK